MRTSGRRSLAGRVSRAVIASCRRFAWGRTLSQALRLRRPWRYLGSAARGVRSTRRYEVRVSGVQVLMRHGSGDTTTFDEVFCSAVYEPPDVIADALQGLGRPPRVLDLGANVGLFSAFAIGRWPGAQITAFEPDPRNLVLLRSCAALNRSRGSIHIVDAAAAATNGTMRFVTGLAAESHRAHSDEHATSDVVRAIDVFDQVGSVDLAKIDIEGGEWEILGDKRLATGRIRTLVLEHHGRHCPSNDPRGTATQLLTAAGYEVCVGGPAVRGVGTLWAWRRPE